MKCALPTGIDSGVTPPTGSCVMACATGNGSPCVPPSVTGVWRLPHGSPPPFALLGTTLYCCASTSKHLSALSSESTVAAVMASGTAITRGLYSPLPRDATIWS
jgi:hypothetical protein